MSEEFVKQLLLPADDAKAEIQERISALLQLSPVDHRALLQWFDDTLSTLDHVFFEGATAYFWQRGGFDVNENYYNGSRTVDHANIPRAVGILKRLITLIDENTSGEPTSRLARGSGSFTAANKKVFVVHGHDEAVREKLERLLEKFELEPIVLNKQANEGKTILEKIEAHSDVGFAIVLFTPDDVGGSIRLDSPSEQRPRQNVLIELGYFWGKIGRNRVCLLNSIGSSISSDLAGLGYTTIDSMGAWRVELARELRRAGYTIDMNVLIDL